MPTVPLVGTFRPQDTPTNAPRANPGMYDGVAQAAQRIGSAVEGIGQAAYGFAERKQAAINSGNELAARTDMDTALQNFKTWTTTHPDQTTWNDEWQSRKQDVSQNILDNYAKAPEVRAKVVPQLQSWSKLSDSHVGSLINEQEIRVSVGQHNDAYSAAVANNDGPGAISVVNDGERHGIYHPAVASQMRKATYMNIDRNTSSSAIESDPVTASKLLEEKDEDGNYVNFTHLNGNLRQVQSKKAYIAVKELQSKNMTQLNADKLSGNPADEMTVKAMVEKGQLDGAWAARYLKPSKDNDEVPLSKVTALIHDYDTKAEDAPAKLDEITKDMTLLNKAAYPIATKLLQEKSNPESPINKMVFSSGKEIIDENFKKGIYGRQSYKVPDISSPSGFSTKVDVNGLNQAQTKRAQALTALQEYVKSNPKATPADVQSFLSSHSKTDRLKSFWAPKINPITGEADK